MFSPVIRPTVHSRHCWVFSNDEANRAGGITVFSPVIRPTVHSRHCWVFSNDEANRAGGITGFSPVIRPTVHSRHSLLNAPLLFAAEITLLLPGRH